VLVDDVMHLPFLNIIYATNIDIPYKFDSIWDFEVEFFKI